MIIVVVREGIRVRISSEIRRDFPIERAGSLELEKARVSKVF
jgi:hypothetical protein